MPHRRQIMLPLGLLALLAGCGQPRFEADQVALVSRQVGSGHAEQINAILIELFGTPDEPRLPDDLPELSALLDLEKLQEAAGPVESHEVGVTTGLYRRHCARCHSVTGNGRGPMSVYQHPYPRDFRRGVFKFSSTPRGVPPTDADLHATLLRGGAGTAMPSFALLKEEERAALVDYVKYLAIRGQLEAELIAFAADEFDYNPLTGEEGAGFSLEDDRELIVDELLRPVVDRWVNAESQTITPPTPPEGFPEKFIERGRELFADSKRVGCIQCHGDGALSLSSESGVGQGAAPIKDFNIWNWRRHEFYQQTESLAAEIERLKSTPREGDFTVRELAAKRKELTQRRQVVAEMLPAAVARPRRLGEQALRGGADPHDLFRRLQQGIDGTPMPSIAGVLSDEEVWSLVAFVLHTTNHHRSVETQP